MPLDKSVGRGKGAPSSRQLTCCRCWGLPRTRSAPPGTPPTRPACNAAAHTLSTKLIVDERKLSMKNQSAGTASVRGVALHFVVEAGISISVVGADLDKGRLSLDKLQKASVRHDPRPGQRDLHTKTSPTSSADEDKRKPAQWPARGRL